MERRTHALAVLLVILGSIPSAHAQTYDYIVVGSGAGGGPLAVRLALRGHSVLLLEAGELKDEDMPYVDVPVFHAAASEHPGTSWEFFVDHYRDEARARRDPKYCDGQGSASDAHPENDACDAGETGIFYPRGSTVGGSTSVNAMIAVLPHASDWQQIADVTGDDSWQPASMATYQQRVEHNVRKQQIEDGAYVGQGAGTQYTDDDGHGTSGWLSIHDEAIFLSDVDNQEGTFIGFSSDVQNDYIPLIFHTGEHVADVGFYESPSGAAVVDFLQNDVNRLRFGPEGTSPVSTTLALGGGGSVSGYQREPVGHFRVPSSVDANGKRAGLVDRILTADRLLKDFTLRTGAFVTRVDFDTSGPVPRATGVTYHAGSNLYEASHQAASSSGDGVQVHARREVIVSAGAFNTPQLLMLSGIGPSEELARFPEIEPVAELEGVGRNLQDRYEVPVVAERTHDAEGLQPKPFVSLQPYPDEEDACRFDPSQLADDRCYEDWQQAGLGSYTQSGAVFSTIRYSPDLQSDLSLNPNTDFLYSDRYPEPDLFIFGLSAAFKGYYPRYSDDLFEQKNRFTWLVLKGHSNNRGRIRLRSANPFDAPDIDFDYFGNPPPGEPLAAEHQSDLDAMVKGVKWALGDIETFNTGDSPATEPEGYMQVVMPNAAQRASDEALEGYVMDHAWGHHASCTAKMGRADDPQAVVDHRFRVYDTQGLRVVDASVFPRIPGFFPAVGIFMMSEKAADAIDQEARAEPGAIFSPETGSTLAADEALIDWKPTPGASYYVLWLGSGQGQSDLGVHIYEASERHALISGLPTGGDPVHARLWSIVPGADGTTYTFDDAQFVSDAF